MFETFWNVKEYENNFFCFNQPKKIYSVSMQYLIAQTRSWQWAAFERRLLALTLLWPKFRDLHDKLLIKWGRDELCPLGSYHFSHMAAYREIEWSVWLHPREFRFLRGDKCLRPHVLLQLRPKMQRNLVWWLFEYDLQPRFRYRQ